jgi:hypothetical protein
MVPRTRPRPLVVGDGNDISPEAPTGLISTATGSFDSITGVTSVSSPIGNSGTPVSDAYTLQLNTNFFSSTTCTASPNPGCQGWEQFVFFNDGSSGDLFIQYWLIAYNTNCPAGWNQFSFTGSTEIYCWRNSNNAVAVPNQPVTNLGQLTLTGTVSATGDSVTLSTGSNLYSVTGDNSVNAAQGWEAAEFNVFGAGGNSSGGGEATFNSGSEIVPRVRIFYGGTAAPICTAQGFTGETNNLSFGPTPPAASQPGPATIFTESSGGGAVSNCAASVSVGDTHLLTFNGLFYDFQASGDFVLAEVGPEIGFQMPRAAETTTLSKGPAVDQTRPSFLLQARQVSGAPTWPNASVNSAVAARVGDTAVVLCLAPERLLINGSATALNDGQSLALTDGIDVSRRGDVYFVVGPKGNSVRAELNPTWINISVGLGRWPTQVRGLLANAGGNVNQIATRDGRVLTTPFAFDELYQGYADSWRVPPEESLLSVCDEGEIERGIPTKPFYAKDLDPDLYERTRAVCTAAGVEEGPLLDACTLDVAVIGQDAAAAVFVGMLAPIVEARPVVEKLDSDTLLRLLLVLLILVVAYLLWKLLIE